jgi:hypothetical protein
MGSIFMIEDREAERVKLLANWFDRASTAMLTIGIFAPLAAAMYSQPPQAVPVAVYFLGYVFWLAGTYIFRRLAWQTLERFT